MTTVTRYWIDWHLEDAIGMARTATRDEILLWLHDLSERARDEAMYAEGFSLKWWDRAFSFQFASFGKFDDAIKYLSAR